MPENKITAIKNVLKISFVKDTFNNVFQLARGLAKAINAIIVYVLELISIDK